MCVCVVEGMVKKVKLSGLNNVLLGVLEAEKLLENATPSVQMFNVWYSIGVCGVACVCVQHEQYLHVWFSSRDRPT